MRSTAVSLALGVAAMMALCASCKQTPPAETAAVDTREAIQIEYVRGDAVEVHARPDAASPILSNYSNGETVSVLSRKDGWAEIRTGVGTGWVSENKLARSHEATVPRDDTTPRFRKAPRQITETTTHGEIELEASVSPDGNVISVRTLRNTTGSMTLEVKNSAALREASFYPIVKDGEKREFVYDYRLHY
jgi:outer membrane biosynthesis protein TonB